LSEPTIWGEASYELLARAFAPIHHDLIARLAPTTGERVLDVACGTGEMTALAADRGAEVIGIDLDSEMIAKAKRRTESIDWFVGDCQELPFEDKSFDVVMSNFGVIFAPDPERAAAELTRVCRGRVGITGWIPVDPRDAWLPCATFAQSHAWSTADGVARLLPELELRAEERTWWLEGESGAAIWDWLASCAPILRARLASASPQEAADTRASLIERWEAHRQDGAIRVPQRYLVAVGLLRAT
jgi:SAM-dependent methyltransferase